MRCNVAAIAIVALLVSSTLASCSSTPPNELMANNRILLTDDGASGAQTDYSGVLGENASHCITVGNEVIIAPNTARLLDNGSVVMNGRTWKQGSRIAISGSGAAETPQNSPCHAKKDGYWLSGPTWTAR